MTKPKPGRYLTRDHIEAVACGGCDRIQNIQPLCVRCNSIKGIGHEDWASYRRKHGFP